MKYRFIVGALCSLLAACGQKGALFLPTEPASQGRATLPQILTPSIPAPASTSSRPAP